LEAAATADKTATPEASAAVPPRAPADEASGRVKEGSNGEGSGACDRYADPIRRLVVEAAQLLEPEGYLFVEHGDLQGPATRALAEAAGLEQVATLKDYSHLDRVLVARKPPAA
jgi:release factor glutamine methyltransferase